MHTTSQTFPQLERRIASGQAWRLLALILPVLALLTVSLHRAPEARAAGGGPIIHWDSSMIYAGQNNGYPWGPVGENTIVHAANFSPDQQLRLKVVPGDSNNNANVCKQAGVTVGTVTTSASGTFDQNFPWPPSAGQVNEGYSICSILVADGSVVSSQDDGPFTVLTSNAPVIDISSTSVQAGATVTVTGHNWVPPQRVNINIAGCAACDPGNSEVTGASTTSHGLNDGSFSMPVMIPASTKPGNYVVDALTPSGLEVFYTTGVKHLAITSAAITSPATANPSTTASPTTSATATATTTTQATTTGTNNSGSSDNGGKSNTLLIIMLVAIALLLFGIAGVIIFMLRHRSSRKVPPAEPAQYMQNMQQNASLPNFGQLQPIQSGWSAPDFSQPTQQEGGYTPYSGQPISSNGPPNNFGQGAVCMNCGRPLPPNAMICSACGMQQAGTQGPAGQIGFPEQGDAGAR